MDKIHVDLELFEYIYKNNMNKHIDGYVSGALDALDFLISNSIGQEKTEELKDRWEKERKEKAEYLRKKIGISSWETTICFSCGVFLNFHKGKVFCKNCGFIKDEDKVIKKLKREKIDKDESVEIKVYEIWSAGHIATGESSGPSLHGIVGAENFKEACDKLASRSQAFNNYYNEEKLTWWGCGLYETEEEAYENTPRRKGKSDLLGN